MDLKEIRSLNSIEEIEERLTAINIEKDNENADVDALLEETRALNEQRETVKQNIETRKADIANIVSGAGETIKHFKKEERKVMDIKEVRNSQEYINAFANYVKTGNDKEVRAALLSTNAETGGSIPVPDFVYEIVKTAWDKNDLLSLVKKVNVKGNMKVSFEVSADGAVIHPEGGDPIEEENIVMGTIELIPQYFKKWKSFSDTVMSMHGEAFIRYIYDEITYRIYKKAADELIRLIAALPQTATTTSVSAAKIQVAPTVGTVATAMGKLSDEATRPVVVMNKATWSLFKQAQYANGFAVDPFEGLAVHFNNSLPAYDTADTGAVYAIVGDFNEGALANFPNGDNVEFIFDELTQKKKNLIEVLGKLYGAVAPVSDRAFTLVAKPAQG